MQQTKLEWFIDKKQNKPTKLPKQQKKDQNYHDSSRQHSQTQLLQPIQQKYNNRPPVQYSKTAQLCKILVLPGPSDTSNFSYILKKLHRLKQKYNPTNQSVFFQFLQNNLKYQKIQNVSILKEIKDQKFYRSTLGKMINFFIQKHQATSVCIRTLVMTGKGETIITRQQALVLLIALFFGIMPKNPLSRSKSFGEWMTKRQNQKHSFLKQQKLKFIINYFKIAIQKAYDKSENFLLETISFQKSSSNIYQIQNDLKLDSYEGKDSPLRCVQFCQQQNTKIQDFYGKAAMIDFANQRIGGGVLSSGCVQQEILFLIFPEAIVSMLITPQMAKNQSIIIYGLKRYSNYSNYSYQTKFAGPYVADDAFSINSSVMIAIDAIDFSSKLLTDIQFNKENTIRQVIKAITGFKAISQIGYKQTDDMKICTGRWGCGAFKGDQIWKFFIQWIACSYAQRQMIYISDQQKIVDQLKYAVNKIIKQHKSVLDIFNLMAYYSEINQRKTKPENYTFIDFLKSHY